jgi:uncharacterized membrane protein
MKLPEELANSEGWRSRPPLPEECRAFGIVVAVIFAAALVAGIMTPASIMTWLSLALGIVLYFFLPGYSLLMLLELDAIERCIFAFPAGAIATSILLYIFNIAGVKFSTGTVLIAILIATGIPFLLWLRKRRPPTSSAQ